jgi:transcriptional regulator with XRE-family HTH domain
LAIRAGVPRPTISLVESGRQDAMSIENLIKIADALNVTLDMLVREDPLQSEFVASLA